MVHPGVQSRLGRLVKCTQLFDILRGSSEDRCTDPRDAVYAYLGLSEEATNVNLAPDYEEHSVEAVYHKYAIHFVQQGRGLHMLQWCSFLRDPRPRIPSWAPR
jgi:hypothetical protein